MAHNAKTAKIKCDIATNPNDTDLLLELVKVDNDIMQLQYKIQQEVEVHLTKQEKSDFRLDGKTYTDRMNKLKLHQKSVCPNYWTVYTTTSRQNEAGSFLGNCQQVLQSACSLYSY